MLTALGFAWSIAAAVVIAYDYLLIGGILVLVSGAFDLFDGALARAKSQETKFGAILDSALDRLSEAAVLFGLLVLYVGSEATWEVLLIYIAIVGSILVSYTRARAEGLGLKCKVGIFTRAPRVIVLALGLIIGQWIDKAVFVVLCILAVFAWLTVLQRLIYLKRQTGEE